MWVGRKLGGVKREVRPGSRVLLKVGQKPKPNIALEGKVKKQETGGMLTAGTATTPKNKKRKNSNQRRIRPKTMVQTRVMWGDEHEVKGRDGLGPTEHRQMNKKGAN